MISPRGLLGVAIRAIGIWYLTEAVYSAFWAVLKAKNSLLGSANITSGEHFQFAIFYALLAVVLLWLADPIVWVLYGAPPKVMPRGVANNPSTDAIQDSEPPP
ncbi:MAG TPA: hypothetical protein VHW69_11715 [Rhizomicrobium sp.]|jgi:hypothetical protein|nr:hypothetical protein [Rhizomicrobium sp.]